MANHSKNRNLKDQVFTIKGEGVRHHPKQRHEHVAREIYESHSQDGADEFLRKLTPAAQDRVMGRAKGTTRVRGWFPSGGRSLRRIELNVRGGMVG